MADYPRLVNAMDTELQPFISKAASEVAERVRALPEEGAAVLRKLGMEADTAKKLAESDPMAAAQFIQKATGQTTSPEAAHGLVTSDPATAVSQMKAGGWDPAHTAEPETSGAAGAAGGLGAAMTAQPADAAASAPATAGLGDSLAGAPDAATIEPSTPPQDVDVPGDGSLGASLGGAGAPPPSGGTPGMSTGKKAAIAGGALGAGGLAVAMSGGGNSLPAKALPVTPPSENSKSAQPAAATDNSGNETDPTAPVVAEVTKRIVPTIIGPKPIEHMGSKDIDDFVARTKAAIDADDLSPADRAKATLSDKELATWKQQRQDLIDLYKEAKNTNQWLQAAETIGHAVVMFAAAKEGLARHVDTSGVAAAMKPTDWLKYTQQSLDELKEGLTNQGANEADRKEQAKDLRSRIDEIARRRGAAAKDETTMRDTRMRANKDIDVANAKNALDVSKGNAELSEKYDAMDAADARNTSDNATKTTVATIGAGSREKVAETRTGAGSGKEGAKHTDQFNEGLALLGQATTMSNEKEAAKAVTKAMGLLGKSGARVDDLAGQADESSWLQSNKRKDLLDAVKKRYPSGLPAAATTRTPGTTTPPPPSGAQYKYSASTKKTYKIQNGQVVDTRDGQSTGW